MTVGTPTLQVAEQLVGGPKLICGTVTAGNGDTTASIDLSSKLAKEIKGVINVMIFKAAAAHAVATIDYTTTATTLTVTFADPTADITIYFSVLGQ